MRRSFDFLASLLATLIIAIVGLLLCSAASAQNPALPAANVDTTMPNTSTYTVKTVCAAGCDFPNVAAAVNAVGCATVISATAGQSETMDTFAWPAKACDVTHWIIVATSDCAPLTMICSHLTAGVQVNGPNQKGFMYALNGPAGNTDSIIAQQGGINFVRFVGIEFNGVASDVGTLVYLGNGSCSDTSTSVIMDRVYVHGQPTLPSNHGIILAAQNSAVIDSYVSDIHSVTNADTQAILIPGSNQGPYLVHDNYLSAAGENMLMGGGGCGNALDVTINQNNFLKPQSWWVNSPTYGGIHWGVKNILEFKAAIRVLAEGNVFDGEWGDAQAGFSIPLTPRSSQNTGAMVNDITLRKNYFRNMPSIFNVAAWDGSDPNWNPATQGVQLHRVAVYQNLGDNINAAFTTNSPTPAMTFFDGPVNFQVYHNSWVNNGITAQECCTPQGSGFIFNNNLVNHGLYGFTSASGGGSGTAALTELSDATYTALNDALVGGPQGITYPASWTFPATWFAAQLVNYNSGNGGDYRVCAAAGNPSPSCTGTSPLHNAASDGLDVGAIWSQLCPPLSSNNPLPNGCTGAPPTFTLSIASTTPASGVVITASPADNSSQTSVTTPGTVNYNSGTAVTLTAPNTAPGGNSFSSWTCNGGTASSTTCSLTVTANETDTANYTAVSNATITVNSTNPSSGIVVTASPADGGGHTSVTTSGTLTYPTGTVVQLTAPTNSGAHPFSNFSGTCSGSAGGNVFTFTVTANCTVSANYAVPGPPTNLKVTSGFLLLLGPGGE